MPGPKLPHAEIKKRAALAMLNIRRQKPDVRSQKSGVVCPRPFFLCLLFSAYCFLFIGCAHYPEYRQRPYYLKAMEAVQRAGSQINFDNYRGALMAGAAKVDITPPAGTSLAGFRNRINVPSVGIHSRLYVRALALSDGEDTVVIVGLDLLGVSDDAYEAVYKRVIEKLPLGREDLLISATHTHAGTGVMGKRFIEQQVMGHFNKDIFEFTTKRIARAIIRAYENMVPARMGAGKGYLMTLSANRMIPGGPIDPELSVIRIDDIRGHPIAFLMNFAAHATVHGSANLYICGDYPGWLQKGIERRFPGVVAIFTSGATGDITHRVAGEFPSSLEKAKEMGRILTEKVGEISENIQTDEKVEIVSLGAGIYLPPVQLQPLGFRIPTFLGQFFLDRKTFKNIILINDILLIAFPGELSVEIGLELKQMAQERGYFPIIINLANDWIGYIVPEKWHHTDAYEAHMSFYGPKMDSYIKEVIREFIGVLERRTE